MREAVALKRWLAEQDPPLANEIFLDVDPDSGLQAGTRWKDALRRANARCEPVVCLLSANWEASRECMVEYRTAENLNKQIFVVRLEPSTGDDLTSEWQRCDLFGDGPKTQIDVGGVAPVELGTEGLYRLRDGIRGAGIGAESFVWPPPGDSGRAPYRGWEPLEETDAAVFFGREAQIVRAMDALRGMRRSGVNSLFVVLGPSGSGKSSFLRAGLLPRLRREDRRFVLLDIVRPERNALTGDAGVARAVCATRERLGLTQLSLGEVKAACAAGDVAAVARWLGEIRAEAAARLVQRGGDGEIAAAPTLVLPLDQAEELFTADAAESADGFLRLLTRVVEQTNATEVGLVVAATIRTDRFEVMQTHPLLAGVGTVLFDELKPMPATQFKEVIVGPAQRASDAGRALVVAPDLVERLLADASGGADTLPMLALVLSRLYTDYGSSGELTVAHYEALGGMGQVVQGEVDDVLAADPQQRAGQLEALRAAFIPWLATINPDNDQPLRRVAAFSDLPEASRPLIDALVGKRLMVKDTRDGQTVVEVALESLLRQWDELAGWLREQRHDLKAADELERSATAWATNDQDSAWLLAGTRLTEAETLCNTTGFRQRLTGASGFLAASRDTENQRLAAEEEQRHAELRAAEERQATAEAHNATLRKRSRILRTVLAATAVVALVAAFAGFSFFRANGQAQARFKSATSQRLVSEAQGMLADTLPGGDSRAFQQLLAARQLAVSPDDGTLYSAVVATVDTTKIINTSSFVNGIALSPDGALIASAESDNTVRLWDRASGQPVGEPLVGHTGKVWSVAFSPDGARLVSGSDDHTLRLWDVATGDQVGDPWEGHTDVVRSVAFSPDGEIVVSGSFDNTARLWSADSGKSIGLPLAGHQGWVFTVAFSPDGSRVATGSYDGTMRLWDATSGAPIGLPPGDGAGAINTVTFSPDGKTLVTGSIDGELRRWDADTGGPIGDLVQVSNNVISLAFTVDGKTLAVGSGDTTVRLLAPDLSTPVGPPLVGHESAVFGIAFEADGRTLVSGSRDTTIRVWDTDEMKPLDGGQKVVSDVAIGPDDQLLVSSGLAKPIVMWNLADREIDRQWPQDANASVPAALRVAFSPDGDRLAAAFGTGTVVMWDTDTWETVGGLLAGNLSAVWGIAFSPDGSELAAVSNTGARVTSSMAGQSRVVFWDTDSGRRLDHEIESDRVLGSIAFAPDGARIVLAGNAGYAQIFDIDSGDPVGAPFDYDEDVGVQAVTYSPDGSRVLTAGADSTVKFWDAETQESVGEPLTGHQGVVTSLEFSPDGHLLATGGGDHAVRLWNVDTGQAYGQPLEGHTDSVLGLAFTSDGQTLASASVDGTVRLWPATAAPEDLCAKLAANMSQKQWDEWVSPEIDYVKTCPDLPVASD